MVEVKSEKELAIIEARKKELRVNKCNLYYGKFSLIIGAFINVMMFLFVATGRITDFNTGVPTCILGAIMMVMGILYIVCSKSKAKKLEKREVSFD
jgi:hypothetical protein